MNVIGTGVSSSTFAVTVAAAPDQLAPCTTTLSALAARITWPATASTHGSAVTAYQILIKKADGTYAEHASCLGNDPTIFANRYCEVAMSTLTSTYALTAGSPILAQVAATNAGGQSTFSMDNTAYITAIREPLAAPVASISSFSTATINLAWTLIAATTASNGGSVVTDYIVELSTDAGTTFGSPVTVAGINTLTYAYTVPTPGNTYHFRVQAVNAFGTSLVYSNVVNALAAQVPDQLAAGPVLTSSGTDVVVTWAASPNVHSSSVTGYRITFLQNSPATYVASATSCLGAGVATTCTIPMSELFSAPFSLAYTANIYAKVEALNAVGYSPISAAGTGVTVLTPPLDAPVLTRNAGTTTTSIIVDWAAIATSGGASVTGYELLVLSGASYTVVATAIAGTTYTHTGRTPGTTYTYKLRALNAYSVAGNMGALSAALPVIAATVAAQLGPVTTANVGTNVVISWAVTGNANSSPVTAYRVMIKVSGVASPQYYEEMTYCDGTTYNVWANVQCTIPMSVFTISPYFLAPNAAILATVEALNGVGYSPVSVDNTAYGTVKVAPTTAPTLANGAGTSNT